LGLNARQKEGTTGRKVFANLSFARFDEDKNWFLN